MIEVVVFLEWLQQEHRKRHGVGGGALAEHGKHAIPTSKSIENVMVLEGRAGDGEIFTPPTSKSIENVMVLE